MVRRQTFTVTEEPSDVKMVRRQTLSIIFVALFVTSALTSDDIMIDGPKDAKIGDNVTLTCSTSKNTGNNEFIWSNNDMGNVINSSDRVNISYEEASYAYMSTLTLFDVTPADSAVYKCSASHLNSSQVPQTIVHKLDVDGNDLYWIVVIMLVIIVIILALLIIIFLIVGKRMGNQQQEPSNPGKTLKLDGRPYPWKFEFPLDKLEIREKLGYGEFVLVKKAEAYGLLKKGKTTTVAVIMVKRGYESTGLESLLSELKILSYLGNNINVVNLLGANTDNLHKSHKLLLLVDYCAKGSLLDHLRKHNGFMNQVNPATGNFDKYYSQYLELGNPAKNKDSTILARCAILNKFFSQNPGTIAAHPVGTSGTPQEDDGYVLLNKPSTWEQKEDCGVKPICTLDLLNWAFQITRGMEYINSKRVLHNNLSLRKVLLTEDNKVKISISSLSRELPEGIGIEIDNKPTPFKWSALEVLTDLRFSTESDVWLYGVTMWQLFTLGSEPYSGINQIIDFLNRGLRLEKPTFATHDIYEIMQECWNANPLKRPPFKALTERVSAILEGSVPSKYVPLKNSDVRATKGPTQPGTSSRTEDTHKRTHTTGRSRKGW